MTATGTTKPQVGTIGWFDLTVDDAEQVRDFYTAVVGWKPSPVSMGAYDDYCMTPPDGDEPVAGVCHKRGTNANLPSHWLMYINIDELDRRVDIVKQSGGEVLHGPTGMGEMGRYCVVRDPAGAVLALYEPAGGTTA